MAPGLKIVSTKRRFGNRWPPWAQENRFGNPVDLSRRVAPGIKVVLTKSSIWSRWPPEAQGSRFGPPVDLSRRVAPGIKIVLTKTSIWKLVASMGSTGFQIDDFVNTLLSLGATLRDESAGGPNRPSWASGCHRLQIHDFVDTILSMVATLRDESAGS